jgi:hypothetical protein
MNSCLKNQNSSKRCTVCAKKSGKFSPSWMTCSSVQISIKHGISISLKPGKESLIAAKNGINESWIRKNSCFLVCEKHAFLGKITRGKMIYSNEPGLLERIDVAVRPLTDNGEFRLERVEYISYYGDVGVVLSSQNFDINFHILLKAPERITCFFIVKHVEKFFGAQTLFSAFNIDIPMRVEKTGGNIEYEWLRLRYRHYQKINEVLLQNSRFIDEIQRLSKEIKRIMPRLEDLFSPEKIEETYRLYLEKARENPI